MTQTSAFDEALLITLHDNKQYPTTLFHASIVAQSSGMIVVTYYIDEIKEPLGKRTLVLSPNSFVSFTGMGYAN